MDVSYSPPRISPITDPAESPAGEESFNIPPRTSDDPSLAHECREMERLIAELEAETAANDAHYTSAEAESLAIRTAAIEGNKTFYTPLLERMAAEVQVMSKQTCDRVKDVAANEQTVAMLRSSMASVHEASMAAAAEVAKEVAALEARLSSVRGVRMSTDMTHDTTMTELRDCQRELAVLMDQLDDAFPDMAMCEAEATRIVDQANATVTSRAVRIGQLTSEAEAVTDEAVIMSRSEEETRAKIAARHADNIASCAQSNEQIDRQTLDLTSRIEDSHRRLATMKDGFAEIASQEAAECGCIEARKAELLEVCRHNRSVLEAEGEVIAEIDTSCARDNAKLRANAEGYGMDLVAKAQWPVVSAPAAPGGHLRIDQVEQFLLLEDKVVQAKGVLMRVVANLEEVKAKAAEARALLRTDKATACLNNVHGVAMTPLKAGTPTKTPMKESPVRKVPAPKAAKRKASPLKAATPMKEQHANDSPVRKVPAPKAAKAAAVAAENAKVSATKAKVSAKKK